MFQITRVFIETIDEFKKKLEGDEIGHYDFTYNNS